MRERCPLLEKISIENGCLADYALLEQFHYRAGMPRGVMRVKSAWWLEGCRRLLAGVVVETLPPLACAMRAVALPGRYDGLEIGIRAARINRDFRTIARVVVAPVFRGMGLGVMLVQQILEHPQSRFVEAFAAMGQVLPLFERAGMTAWQRPTGPAEVRLLAALDAAGVRNLWQLEVSSLPPGLWPELRRFARDKRAGPTAWLREARQRLGSAPVYYLWQSPIQPPVEIRSSHHPAAQEHSPPPAIAITLSPRPSTANH